MSKPELKLDWCSASAARFACERWHYSKTLPMNKINYIGVWENGQFIGVIIFGLGASPSLGKPYGLEMFAFAELTRVALHSHISPVSRILSIATRMLHKKNPRLRLLISFADPFHLHNGGIYQATNWIFNGRTSPSEMLQIDGNYVDPRRYNGHGHNRRRSVPKNAIRVKVPGKYRYLMPLDAEMRERIKPLAKPYPKRVTSIDSDAAAFQVAEGGAIPTVTLQN